VIHGSSDELPALPGVQDLSERKLMDCLNCLNRLGYDIEIKVRPAKKPVGHLTMAFA
jgi:hypothetical protein